MLVDSGNGTRLSMSMSMADDVGDVYRGKSSDGDILMTIYRSAAARAIFREILQLYIDNISMAISIIDQRQKRRSSERISNGISTIYGQYIDDIGDNRSAAARSIFRENLQKVKYRRCIVMYRGCNGNRRAATETITDRSRIALCIVASLSSGGINHALSHSVAVVYGN